MQNVIHALATVPKCEKVRHCHDIRPHYNKQSHTNLQQAGVEYLYKSNFILDTRGQSTPAETEKGTHALKSQERATSFAFNVLEQQFLPFWQLYVQLQVLRKSIHSTLHGGMTQETKTQRLQSVVRSRWHVHLVGKDYKTTIWLDFEYHNPRSKHYKPP